jgi:DNA-binding transcriptional LysR family regulator
MKAPNLLGQIGRMEQFSLDLKELEALVAVSEYLHFGAAAQHLGVAQPQVSRRIRSLEEKLDVTLFVRNNRGVKLTPYGRAFLPDAVELLRKAAETRQRAFDLAKGQNGILTVSMIDAATLNAGPPVFKVLHERRPGVHISFRNWGATSAAQILALADNSADVVFTHPPERMPENLCQIRLVNDPLVAVLPKTHPLAGRAKLDLGELRHDRWIMFPRSNDPPVYDRMIGLCAQRGYAPEIAFEMGHMLTRLGLVASGFGVHLVHRAWALMPFPGVAYVPVEPTTNIVVSCLWRRDNDSEILADLIEIARGFEV